MKHPAESPQARAHRIAESAANRFDTTHIAHEWYTVTRPGGEVFELFLCPPQTHAQVLAMYPHAGVVAA